MEKEEYEELRKILLSYGILEKDVESILKYIQEGGSGEFLNENG